ncbi:MAG: hypothetical protein LW832_03410 [Parachlamydia sp.]|jgi:hypothetical protein|nr:hypothetical protein [Parachlamydia sp.]
MYTRYNIVIDNFKWDLFDVDNESDLVNLAFENNSGPVTDVDDQFKQGPSRLESIKKEAAIEESNQRIYQFISQLGSWNSRMEDMTRPAINATIENESVVAELNSEKVPSLDAQIEATVENETVPVTELDSENVSSFEAQLKADTADLLTSKKRVPKKRSKMKAEENKVKRVVEDRTPKFTPFTGSTKRNDDSYKDQSGLAEFLKKPEEGAKKHVAKRMDSFFTLCNYINEKKEFFKNYEFSKKIEKNEFAAQCYYVDDTYRKNNKFERVHISIINKLILTHIGSNNKFYVDDKITYNKKIVDLKGFLNACDVTSKLINDIDSNIEFKVRLLARDLFNQIISDQKTPEEATNEMKSTYKKELIELQNDLNGYVPKIQANTETKANIKKAFEALKSKENSTQSVKLINKMIEAL